MRGFYFSLLTFLVRHLLINCTAEINLDTVRLITFRSTLPFWVNQSRDSQLVDQSLIVDISEFPKSSLQIRNNRFFLKKTCITPRSQTCLHFMWATLKISLEYEPLTGLQAQVFQLIIILALISFLTCIFFTLYMSKDANLLQKEKWLFVIRSLLLFQLPGGAHFVFTTFTTRYPLCLYLAIKITFSGVRYVLSKPIKVCCKFNFGRRYCSLSALNNSEKQFNQSLSVIKSIFFKFYFICNCTKYTFSKSVIKINIRLCHRAGSGPQLG